jgi:hypothetical protein
MFMRTDQQSVFLALNSVPVTFVIDPKLIRTSIPVAFFGPESCNKKSEDKKVRGLGYFVVGNVQAKVHRRHRLVILFLSSNQPGAFPKGTPKCV